MLQLALDVTVSIALY